MAHRFLMLLHDLMKSHRLYLLHTHTRTNRRVRSHYSSINASLGLSWQVWLPHAGKQIIASKHTLSVTLQGIFPILALHNGHFVTQTLLSQPHPQTLTPQPWPSTPHWLPAHPSLNGRLCKWTPTTMASPHISDVHSLKSIVCLWDHVLESAHECSNSARDGYGLDKQPTSQVLNRARMCPVSHMLQCFSVDFPYLL